MFTAEVDGEPINLGANYNDMAPEYWTTVYKESTGRYKREVTLYLDLDWSHNEELVTITGHYREKSDSFSTSLRVSLDNPNVSSRSYQRTIWIGAYGSSNGVPKSTFQSYNWYGSMSFDGYGFPDSIATQGEPPPSGSVISGPCTWINGLPQTGGGYDPNEDWEQGTAWVCEGSAGSSTCGVGLGTHDWWYSYRYHNPYNQDAGYTCVGSWWTGSEGANWREGNRTEGKLEVLGRAKEGLTAQYEISYTLNDEDQPPIVITREGTGEYELLHTFYAPAPSLVEVPSGGSIIRSAEMYPYYGECPVWRPIYWSEQGYMHSGASRSNPGSENRIQVTSISAEYLI
jgi:hypothetical protein